MPDAVMGDLVANHWVDANHKRGLWRVSPLAAYLAGKPEWRTLIDVDALGKAEGKSWVWHGANCLPPEYQRCLVSLSPGGSDADVVREFDLATGQFVDGGFVVPEGKNSATWVDRDTLLVARGRRRGDGDPLRLSAHRQGVEARHAVERRDHGRRSDRGRHRHQPVRGDGRRHPPRRDQPRRRLLRIRVSMRAPDGRWVDCRSRRPRSSMR